MANEAKCIETPTEFRRYTIGAGAVLPIGTLLKLTTPNTATATGADTDEFAGIAWEESNATSTKTEIVAAVNGVWDILATGAAVTAGLIVNVGGANQQVAADSAAIVAGSTIGKALEAANATYGRVAVGRLV